MVAQISVNGNPFRPLYVQVPSGASETELATLGAQALMAGFAPKQNWPEPMVIGWENAGRAAYAEAMRNEDIGRDSELGPFDWD